MSATDVLNAVSDAMEVFAELPLRVFDIKVTRKDNERSCIRITRGDQFIEVLGKFGKRIKIDSAFINAKTSDDLHYSAALCPNMSALTIHAHFRHAITDGKEEWTSADPQYSTKPSDKSVKAVHAAIKNVAERILTRFSRVDLL